MTTYMTTFGGQEAWRSPSAARVVHRACQARQDQDLGQPLPDLVPAHAAVVLLHARGRVPRDGPHHEVVHVGCPSPDPGTSAASVAASAPFRSLPPWQSPESACPGTTELGTRPRGTGTEARNRAWGRPGGTPRATSGCPSARAVGESAIDDRSWWSPSLHPVSDRRTSRTPSAPEDVRRRPLVAQRPQLGRSSSGCQPQCQHGVVLREELPEPLP